MKKKLVRYLLPALLIVVAAVFSLLRFYHKTGKPPLNLLLITLDTTRADRLGCYGDKQAVTPVLDALALSGILFENCQSPVPLTLPAHCSLFTGRWPIGHGVRNNGSYKLNEAEKTLAEELEAAGYDTVAIVAAYVLKSKFGLAQGFNLYDDRFAYEEKAGNIDAEIPADRVYDKFRIWLGLGHKKPFFLWVHFYDAHKPYAPPPAYLPAAGGDAYRGEVAYVDSYIGRMIVDLKEHRLFERTLIVVVGDHGEAFGEHGEKGHGIFCYDESLRVPLILANPFLIKKPARVVRPASLVDVVPTVLEMLGVAAAETWQGKSQVAAMAAGVKEDSRPLYFESMYGRELKNWAPLTGLIKGGFKYISLPQAELYDLKNDPAEKDNLFFKKNILSRQMDRELAAFISERWAAGKPSAPTALSAEDKAKLAALGYVSGFAPAGISAAGVDPKTGIGYEARFSDMSAALDRGETARVEAEALRLRDETAGLKLSLAYLMLDYVYKRTRQWDKLEANLRRACELFKDTPGQVMIFRINLLEFYLANGRLNSAEALAKAMLRSDPEKIRVLEVLGEICEKRRDWPGALDWYSQANRSESNNATLTKKKISLLLKTGDKQAALAASETLLQSADGASDSELLFSTAMLAFETGDSGRSEALLLRLCEIQPTAQRWFDYALVLGRNGKFIQAIAVMEKALATTPNDLDAERLQAANKALRVWKSRQR
ncbi:MAG: sulfatase-like hydrolase/transferase [Candidatus Aminicenantes bacterium]|nr:sulfatase-like hydrolase/transferase [Candidatus Aminicenantes bacterium]